MQPVAVRAQKDDVETCLIPFLTCRRVKDAPELITWIDSIEHVLHYQPASSHAHPHSTPEQLHTAF